MRQLRIRKQENRCGQTYITVEQNWAAGGCIILGVSDAELLARTLETMLKSDSQPQQEVIDLTEWR